jgi:MFS family permease
MPIFKNKLYYGWVVVAAFLVIGTIMYGIHTSFGVFFKSIEGEFILNRTATSTIFSVQNIFGCVLSFVGGWAADKYGPRMVALFIGLLAGLSLLLTSQTNEFWQLFITYSLFSVIGAVYTMIMSVVSRWFDKNRGLALGIAGAGIGLGQVAIAPLASYLISSFDWRMAYIIMGLIAWLVIIPLSRLLKRNPDRTGVKLNNAESGSAEFSLRAAFGTRSFWLFSSIWLLTSFCYFLILIHIVPHATDIGISPMEAATVLSVIGVSYIAGRLLMGKLSDIIGGKKTAIVCSLLAAISLMRLIWPQDLVMLYIFGIVFGLAQGGLDTSVVALISNTFGMRNIGTIIGALQFTWGIGMIIGPAVGGLIFDTSNSYFLAFVISMLAMLLVTLFLALTRQEMGRKQPT